MSVDAPLLERLLAATPAMYFPMADTCHLSRAGAKREWTDPARHQLGGAFSHQGLPVIMLQQFISNTPVWVWVLLVFLITRGVAAMKPGETSLTKLAIVPALFTAWGLWSISQRFGSSWEAWGEWLVGIGAGIGLGWMLLRRATLTINTSTGKLWRSADFSLLPLLLVTFAVKYGFESALSVSPSLSADGGFRAAYLLLSGGFTGIFVGKYLRYLRASRLATPHSKVEAVG